MQVTNYSNFRKHLKSYIDDCVTNNSAVVINREEAGSVVLIPLEKYKDMDETEFLQLQKKYASEVLDTFTKMKANAGKLLTPETYKTKYGK